MGRKPASSLENSSGTASTGMPLNRLLVGGKLVGNRPEPFPNNHRYKGVCGTFEPIITPEVQQCNNNNDHRKKTERYVLLPHSRFISVLSYKTGIKVATLVPSTKNDEDDVLIECVGLVRYQRKAPETTAQDVLDRMDMANDEGDNDENRTIPDTNETVEETLVMVGCRDGSLREFSLQALTTTTNNNNKRTTSSHKKQADLGAYSIAGPCYFPRRVVRVLKKDPIMHLAIPHLPLQQQVRKDGILVYVAARRLQKQHEAQQQDADSSNNKHYNTLRPGSTFSVEVLRVLVPHFDASNSENDVRVPSTCMRTIDKFKSRLFVSKKKNTINTLPFRMLSVANTLSSRNHHNGNVDAATPDSSVFVVLARSNAISIYYDQLDASESFPPLSISMPSNNPLTALEIALNKADITCGHHRGNICVINHILKDVEQYQIARRKEKELKTDNYKTTTTTSVLPPDPRKNMITTRVHWHALPVSTIVYDSMSYAMDPLLYSGGEESVLVTWQISHGKDRPVQVHPRIALGGILRLASCDRCDEHPTSGMLVYCEDNSLQLLESHNKGRLWKIQGLACTETDDGDLVSLETDPRSSGQQPNSQLVLTGLKKAPGYMHWFDPMRERLVSSLEVVPFNRISRNEPEERPLPTPTIIGHVFGNNGQDLITIDESPTENTSVGAKLESKTEGKTGAVGTIRFWSWNDSSVARREASPPYQEIASMTFPHGPKNRVSALAMSKDGSMACTVSCDEKSFRIWQKSRALGRRGGSNNNKSSSWACKYKVKFPAGLSNRLVSRNGLAFSEDNSLLAIAFDTIGTIWDTDGGRLLTTFDHSQGSSCSNESTTTTTNSGSSIESVRFVSPGVHQDLLLIRSSKCVSLRSPYGPNGCSGNFEGWSWSVHQSAKGSTITAVELIESHECVAVSIHNPGKDQSKVVLIDVDTGRKGIGGNDASSSSSSSSIEKLDGSVRSLCAVGKPRVRTSNWDNNNNNKDSKSPTTESPMMLYALMNTGDLVLCSTQDTYFQSKTKGTMVAAEDFVSAAPRLDISTTNTSEPNRRKRQRTNDAAAAATATASASELFGTTSSSSKRLAIDVFGFGRNHDSTVGPSTAELPSLGSNFVRTFLGRNLQKSKS